MTRRGALPPTAVKLLQDQDSVQLLDGDEHKSRKRLFLSLLDPIATERLTAITEGIWIARLARWSHAGEIVLLDEAREILCEAVCQWAGIVATRREIEQRSNEFAAMLDAAVAVGPRNWWAQVLRARTERWAKRLIDNVRTGALDAPQATALTSIAWHRDATGSLLSTDVAAVELINVLRPTVAVANFVVLAALALHDHPSWMDHLRANDADLEPFVQEVRHHYPFFPMVGGRVERAFDWRGHHFPAGTWMLLDLYGTNHDARTWHQPDQFHPNRFRAWDPHSAGFVPQGGGDPEIGHRCPGELATVELMKTAVRLLTTSMRYRVPPQHLSIDLARMPAVPKSRFVIDQVVSS